MLLLDAMEGGQTLKENVLEGDVENVRFYLSKNYVNLNDRDVNGRTILHTAVAVCHNEENSDVIKLLLDAGADATAADKFGNTPLHWCSNMETVKILSDYGADPLARNFGGLTPRAMAARRGVDVEVLDYLENLEGRCQSVSSYPPGSKSSGPARSFQAHLRQRERERNVSADKMCISVLMEFYLEVGPRNMILLVLGLLFMSLYIVYMFIGIPEFTDTRVTINNYDYRVRI